MRRNFDYFIPMKRVHIIIVAVLLMLAGFFSSCEKTHCPGFPSYLTDYYPYKRGSIFSFVNQNNDTMSFWVRDFFVSLKQTKGKCDKCGTYCDPPGFVFTAFRLISKSLADELGYEICREIVEGKIISSGLLKGVMQVAYNEGKETCISFTIFNSYWDFDYVNKSNISEFTNNEESGKDPFDPKNCAIFGETVIHENSDQQISRIVIVKGKEITEFYDQVHDFQWKCINNKQLTKRKFNS